MKSHIYWDKQSLTQAKNNKAYLKIFLNIPGTGICQIQNLGASENVED